MLQRLRNWIDWRLTGQLAAALVWCVFILGVGLLSGFRSVKTSSMAALIEFKDVPLLEFMDTNFDRFNLATGLMGLSLVVLVGLWYWYRRTRPIMVLGIVTALSVITATVANRAADLDPGVFDWVTVVLVIGTTVAFMRAVSADAVERGGPLAPQPRPPRRVHLLAILYLLSVGLVVVFAAVEHFRMWSPERNGGYDYGRFFGEGEIPAANLVLFSTSILFASMAGAAACMWSFLFKLTHRSWGEPCLYRELRLQATLSALTLSAVTSVPWLAKLAVEIEGEENFFFPVGIVVFTYALLVPLLFLCALLLERDFGVLNEGSKAAAPQPHVPVVFAAEPVNLEDTPEPDYTLEDDLGGATLVPAAKSAATVEYEETPPKKEGFRPFVLGRSDRTFLALTLFPVYFLLRLARPRRWPRLWYVFVLAVGIVVLSSTMRMAHEADALWGFEDWRDMMKGAQFPVIRIFLSLAAAAALIRVVQRPVEWFMARKEGRGTGLGWSASRWSVTGSAILCVGFASWPFWGWDGVSHNVHARVVEYNDRHKFERSFLHWMLDFDGDGYASLLQGGDPDDSDPEVQAGGLGPLYEIKLPEDEFEIVDEEQAKQFPNVLLLHFEGVTPRAISAYGQRNLGRPATPAIDGVAGQGMRFDRVYCCYPSTWDGWFQSISGRILCIQEFTSSVPFGDRYSRYNNLYKVLKLAGINRWCFPNYSPYVKLFLPHQEWDEDWEPGFSSSPSDEEKEQEITRGDLRTQRILRFIDSVEPGDRFFISEHMGDTHFPWRRVSLPTAHRLGYPEGLEWAGADAIVDGMWLDKQARYYQQVTRMDAQVRQILDRLKRRGVYHNTMVILVSDHGCQWYEHEHLYYVSHLYEQSIRVPLIMRVPGYPQGLKTNAPATLMDIMATVMDLAGARQTNTDRPLFGKSLLPFMRGTADQEYANELRSRDLLLKTHYDTLGIIKDFRYKLIFNRPLGTLRLFDLVKDPMEMTNLADEEPDLLIEMLERLRLAADRHPAFLGGIQRSNNPIY